MRRPPPSSTLFPYTTLFRSPRRRPAPRHAPTPRPAAPDDPPRGRSEEHTSELQSRFDLVCRLLLEKKKKSTLKTQYTIRTRRCHRRLASTLYTLITDVDLGT